MKSTLKNMVLVLLGITFVSSAAVGFIYRVTEEPIEQAKQANVKSALAEVLPAFDESVSQELVLDELALTVHTATQQGQTVGYAVETATKNGFSGLIRMMVGFDAEGNVLNVKVLEHNETPGLGSKMADEGNPLLASFQGKNPASMKLSVRKDGGEVDALTAATISSRAYVDAVARAYNAYLQASGNEGTDVTTGATGQHAQQEGESYE